MDTSYRITSMLLFWGSCAIIGAVIGFWVLFLLRV